MRDGALGMSRILRKFSKKGRDEMNHRSVLASTFFMAYVLGNAACSAEGSSTGGAADGLTVNLDWSDVPQERDPVGNTASIRIVNDTNGSESGEPTPGAQIDLWYQPPETRTAHGRAASVGGCRIFEYTFSPGFDEPPVVL